MPALLIAVLLNAIGGYEFIGPAADSSVNDVQGYEYALTRVREATIATNIDAAAGAPELESALQALLHHAPTLSSDPGGRELQVMGELALARAALIQGDREQAKVGMDRVLTILLISDEMGDFEPSKLGPQLRALFDERKAASPYHALSRIRSSSSCSIFVDGRKVDGDLVSRAGVPAAVGRHHVFFECENESSERFVDIASLGETIEVAGPVVTPEAPAPALVESTSGDGRSALEVRASNLRRPVAPRWAEATLVAAGLAATGAGASLWALDDSCAGPGPRTGVGACANLFDTKTAGITTLSAGVSVALTGIIMLAVDERRRRSGGVKWSKRR